MFPCFLVCIHAILNLGRNITLKSKVVFIVLIYTIVHYTVTYCDCPETSQKSDLPTPPPTIPTSVIVLIKLDHSASK